GSGSSRVTFFAVPGPALETVIVKPMSSPALTGDASAFFTIDRSGLLHVMSAESCASGVLSEVAVALLSYSVHSAKDVVAVTWRVKLLPEPRSTGSHFSSWLPTAPVIAQFGVTSPVGPESIDQVTPAPEPAGSGLSSRTTFFAVPGPALATVIVNPMSSPAST